MADVDGEGLCAGDGAARPLAAAHAPAPPDEEDILTRLRAGDESAFSLLVDRHHASMVRVAGLFVRGADVAEEVAQEAWLAVFEGVERFEGRSSLKTWLFRILTNIAKTRGAREKRSVPLSSYAPAGADDTADDGPLIDPSRFAPAGTRWPGHWTRDGAPRRWEDHPEARALSKEVRGVIERAVEALPEGQRRVITLRDLLGFSSEEVCATLGLTSGNERIILHRARSRVRGVLERYYEGVPGV